MCKEKDTRCVAAICYLEQDRDYALKMQKFMASYKLPSAISKNNSVEKESISVICCEIRLSGDLMADKPEYIGADYLILLCSKELADRDLLYLDFDLRSFMEQKWNNGINPSGRIIPVSLSDGNGEQDYCPGFVKSLWQDGSESILRREQSNDREIFLHVISRLLGMQSSTLADREQRKHIRLRIAAGAMLAAVVLLGLLCVKLFVPFEYHYLDFTMQYGIPVGIHSLTHEERERTAAHYVLTKVNGHVVSLEYVDSYGRRIDHDSSCWRTGNRPSAYWFEYKNSKLTAVTYEDRFGRPYFVMEYSHNNRIVLKDPYDRSVPYYLRSGFTHATGALLTEAPLDYAPRICAFVLKYSDEGYVSEAWFEGNAEGTLGGDRNVYGVAYSYDSKGRITRQWYLDAEGQSNYNYNGVAANCFVYDEKDRCTEQIQCDMEGKVVAKGHLIAQYDTNHNLVLLTRQNASKVRRVVEYTVDNRGKVITMDSQRYHYDAEGYLTEMTLLDAYDADKNEDYTYAQVRYVRDEMGNALEEWYLDALGEPACPEGSYGRIRRTYNRFGQVTCCSYWNAEGTEQVNTQHGYSSEVTTYDDRGRITSVSYFDPEGAPAMLCASAMQTNYHKMLVAYEDGYRRTKTVSCYDTQGQPAKIWDETIGMEYASSVSVIENGLLRLLIFTAVDGSETGIEQEFAVNDHGERELITRSALHNRIIRRTIFRPNGVLLCETSFQYDSENVLNHETITTYFPSGATMRVELLMYNELGEPVWRFVRTFDNNGVLVDIIEEEL